MCSRRYGRLPLLDRAERREGDGIVLAGAKQEELVALNLRRRDVWSVHDRLDANIEGFFDRVADGEGEVEGTGEGMSRVVGDARVEAHRDNVRNARVNKGLSGRLREAGAHKHEA